MRFLRLATNCAVFDDRGQILLSKRGDLNVWNLPGGRLDSGEPLMSAAAREVREETGIIAHVERAVGLYYAEGWDRLNLLYAGFPVGGDLVQKTYETRENRFFPPDALPGNLPLDRILVQDASSSERPLPRITTSSPAELQRVKWALRRRYVTNLLRGKPEPRHVRFNLHAVGVVWERSKNHLLTLSNRRMRSLPRVVCDGSAPWVQLAASIQPYLKADLQFQWAGIWQYPETDSIEFVFAATVRENLLSKGAEWSPAQNPALNDRDAEYVRLTPPDYRGAAVWSIVKHDRPVNNTIMLS